MTFKEGDKVRCLLHGYEGEVGFVSTYEESILFQKGIPVQVRYPGQNATYCYTLDGRARYGGDIILELI
ncbi:MAG: hypothetical protein KAR06_11030 [Deltaproteobacteria bacterium]|nr:hypothetical protein [Deltaproteobacteria bacterium]